MTEPAGEPVTDSERAASSAAELVEVIDADGHVERLATRAEMRSDCLRHRCVYIAVLTNADELIVHQRAHWKGIYPGFWDLAFGGICDVGEAWADAAQRELAEESGLIEVPLQDLGEVRYEAEDGRIIGRVYLARTDEEPTCPDGEVIGIDRVPLDQLDAWMDGRDVALDTRTLLPPLLNER